jgi:hypothetical protein
LAQQRVLDPIYLPFPLAKLAGHFAPTFGGNPADADRHVKYYLTQVAKYHTFKSGLAPPTATSKFAQIEKDERVWIVSALMSYFHHAERGTALSGLLSRALGREPPLEGFNEWTDAFGDELRLFFEGGLPSPSGYREWLSARLASRQPVPYLLQAGQKRGLRLEGHTQADALLLDGSTGCAVIFEAKAFSDVSIHVTFDVMRNQIARNIDCMLEDNPKLAPPLNQRRPERTMFVLLTPRMFQEHPASRLFGGLMREYRENPSALQRDLPHRDVDWEAVSRRIGWLTWEDCEEILPGSCRWLQRPDE